MTGELLQREQNARVVFVPSGHVKPRTPGEMRRTLQGIGFEVQAQGCMPFGFWAGSLHGLGFAGKR